MQCRPCLAPRTRIIDSQPLSRSAQEPLPPLAAPHAAVFRALGERLESLGQSLTLYAGRQRHDQAQVRALLEVLDPRGSGAHIWEWSQVFEDPALVPSNRGSESQRIRPRDNERGGPPLSPSGCYMPPRTGTETLAPMPPAVLALPMKHQAAEAAVLVSVNGIHDPASPPGRKAEELEQKLEEGGGGGGVARPRLAASFDQELTSQTSFEHSNRRLITPNDLKLKSRMSFMIRDTVAGEHVPPPVINLRANLDAKKNTTGTMQRMDSFIGAVILMNALILALSLDIDKNWEGWEAFEYFFLLIFFSEIVFKLHNLGCSEYFLGTDRYWNIFDTSVVSFGIFELVSTIVREITKMKTSSNMGDFVRMVKILRLTRLARVVRLLRYKVFTELKAMVLGVLSGLRVLFWAIFLFFIFIFLIAIILRSSVGEDDDLSPEIKSTFDRMPWAMFTLFRCFTDGCAAHDGTPLQVHLYKQYGAWFSISYMAVFLFVTIGLFNLIMAVFVDNVMESTKQRRQMERAEDADETERCLRSLVKKLIRQDQAALKTSISAGQLKPVLLLSICQQLKNWAADFFRKTPVHIAVARATCRMSGFWPSAGTVPELPAPTLDEDAVITPVIFNAWLLVPEFRGMLEVLEISSSNPRELFDVLDADMSGELGSEELVVGLMNLRGPADKSYTVASLLCIRVVQQMLRNFVEESNERHDSLVHILQPSSGISRLASPGSVSLGLANGWAKPGLTNRDERRPSAASLGLANVD